VKTAAKGDQDAVIVELSPTTGKVIGSATIRSRSATLATLLTGALAGMAGVAAGPVASAILLGLAGGVMTATVNWAAPAVRLLVAFRDE
jgi:hypothetical protein